MRASRSGANRYPLAIAFRGSDGIETSIWSVATAARALGVGRTNLHKRMKILGVERK